jgi:hypothetical protein
LVAVAPDTARVADAARHGTEDRGYGAYGGSAEVTNGAVDAGNESSMHADELREEVEKVLVVTVDSKTGEIIDALVQSLDGFIRVLAEAAQKKAETGEPIDLKWVPAAGTWWRPKA